MKSGQSREISFLCFGGEDWWYHNRAHTDMQLMRRFSRTGTSLYVNSIMMRKHKIIGGSRFVQKLVRKIKSLSKGLKQSGAGFWVYSPFTLPVHHISWAKPLNTAMLSFQIRRTTRKLRMIDPVVWVVCPAACDTAVNIDRAKLIYQRTDRFEDDPDVDRDAILAYDRKLKANADITVYVNRLLYDEEAGQCRNALFLDHGVDYEMFATAEGDPDRPSDIREIRTPIVGYFGALDGHKLDTGFLEAVADRLPDMSFVFIGKPSVDCSELSAKQNVWMLGQKNYEEIPHYGKCFDVAILPWRVNKWTEAANPIKLKEYLALGKPIVSTPAFSELQSYRDVVYQAKSPEEFAECITRACSEDSPELVGKRRKKVARASWDSKAEAVLAELFN
ncbi:MAG: glycosyltransferase [Planctomycetota bacterium]|jgi:glycosyltransferase involved in cell wall biosynthesis